MFNGPPWWYNPGQSAMPMSPGDAIKQLSDGIEELSKLKKTLEEKDKKDDKKKPEGLSKTQVFWLMLMTAPITGPIMCYLWLNSLNVTMTLLKSTFHNIP